MTLTCICGKKIETVLHAGTKTEVKCPLCGRIWRVDAAFIGQGPPLVRGEGSARVFVPGTSYPEQY